MLPRQLEFIDGWRTGVLTRTRARIAFMTLTSCLRGTSAASVFNMAMQKLSSGTMILFVCVVVVIVAGVKRLRERGSSWVCDEGCGRRVQGAWAYGLLRVQIQRSSALSLYRRALSDCKLVNLGIFTPQNGMPSFPMVRVSHGATGGARTRLRWAKSVAPPTAFNTSVVYMCLGRPVKSYICK